MAYRTTIVCLANSRKMGERCVAGREFIDGRFGRWVRPVSDRRYEELSERERLYADKGEPAVLDIIDIEMVAPRPHHHQQENHLVNRRRRWTRLGAVSWDRLADAADHPRGPLWLNGYSSVGGVNDRIPEDVFPQIRNSLTLVRPDHLTLSGGPGDVRATFALGGSDYRLRVTDPLVESRMATMEGDLTVQNAYLCISLSEPFQATPDQPTYVYKLIAAVITPRRNRAA